MKLLLRQRIDLKKKIDRHTKKLGLLSGQLKTLEAQLEEYQSQIYHKVNIGVHTNNEDDRYAGNIEKIEQSWG